MVAETWSHFNQMEGKKILRSLKDFKLDYRKINLGIVVAAFSDSSVLIQIRVLRKLFWVDFKATLE